MTFRRWILLALLIVALLAFFYRDQLYARDFRAHVTRNGAAEDGAQVFTSLAGSVSSGVLLENDNAPMYIVLIQQDKPIRTPVQIACIHFFICFIPNDNATLAGTDLGARLKSLTADEVEFRDPEGRDARIALR